MTNILPITHTKRLGDVGTMLLVGQLAYYIPLHGKST